MNNIVIYQIHFFSFKKTKFNSLQWSIVKVIRCDHVISWDENSIQKIYTSDKMWLAIVIQMASGSNARRLARSTFRFHTFLLFFPLSLPLSFSLKTSVHIGIGWELDFSAGYWDVSIKWPHIISVECFRLLLFSSLLDLVFDF